MVTKTLTPVGAPDENGVQQYSIAVTFEASGNPVFTQDVISALTGEELDAQMQAYADQYEIDWKAANGF